MALLVSKTGIEIEIPDIKKVEHGAPYRWLARGWADFKDNVFVSLSLGLIFVLIGYLASYAVWQAPWALMTAITGFLLMAPVLAIGFYAISCAHEKQQIPTLGEALSCWRGNGRSVLLYGLVLFLVLFIWSRFNWLVTALLIHATGSMLTLNVSQIIGTPQGWMFIATYIGVGALFAIAVFSGSVVTLQLMMDRNTDPITAIVTSLRVAITNKRTMILWAALIFGLTAFGLATAYIGLLVIFPLLGHASWHAYRDLIE